ncbi:short-subunit dehydrogenase [Chitinophaga skermanii]|uniref:Short-subunit dehydrogenase n=1 Tax=Chitinophaga skermanii TaxID=331697 RepID=A0A327QKJ1_9BACT|nr:SDR family oxidoreductase [Chitinophaga skermanii]RAJ05166.1 short-subunit dehydrogenase [Chitinophaga skermanii]
MEFYKGKVVWITGASSGIGKELALQLAHTQAKLILTGRNELALATLQEQCLAYTPSCAILPADLAQPELLEPLAQQAIKTFGHIDVLINNAGVTQRDSAENTQPQVIRQLMEINFFSPVLLTKALLPHFRARGGGAVAVVGSMAGLMGFPYRTSYSAAKHALKGFFETLQVEHMLPNFHITIVSPGRIQTPISLRALTGDGQAYNKMNDGQLHGIPVEICARKIINGIAKHRKHVIVARQERILWLMRKWCTPLYYYVARKAGKADA